MAVQYFSVLLMTKILLYEGGEKYVPFLDILHIICVLCNCKVFNVVIMFTGLLWNLYFVTLPLTMIRSQVYTNFSVTYTFFFSFLFLKICFCEFCHSGLLHLKRWLRSFTNLTMLKCIFYANCLYLNLHKFVYIVNYVYVWVFMSRGVLLVSQSSFLWHDLIVEIVL